MDYTIEKASFNLFVHDSDTALDFYKKVFGAKVLSTYADEKVGEKGAHFTIGDSLFALANENPQYGSKSPVTLGGNPVCIQLFVSDIEKVVKSVVAAGGEYDNPSTEETPVHYTADNEAFGSVMDPFGYVWSISKIVD